MIIRDLIRKCTPDFMLNWNRKRKKSKRNIELLQQKEKGKILTEEKILEDLKRAGIQNGDILLVHSSLSKIGYLENGPGTFVNALLKAVGESGTILMPSSPNAVYQYDFIKGNPVFDVLNTPSRMGAITEYFRKLPGVKRSLHPTEPICALGPMAEELVKDHFNQITPYNDKSPFRKISELNGKIMYVGVTLANAGTNLHTIEDAVNFKFPVYADEVFSVEVIDEKGVCHSVKTKVHNPEFSKKRKCDELIPLLIQENAMTKINVGEAQTLVVDAAKFFNVLLEAYHSKGITMYTPQGSK